MKYFFKRLKYHPGFPVACFMPFVGGLLCGESFVFGFIFTALVIWSLVLLSNK